MSIPYVALWVCPVCYHAIDERDNPSRERGCFGGKGAPAHAKARRQRFTVYVGALVRAPL